MLLCCTKKKNCKAPRKRTQHCWPTTPNIVGCNMLRPFSHSVACCWKLLRKVWIFEPRTPNISVVPWSPKRCTTKLDPSNNTNVSNVLWVVSFPQWTTGPNIIGSCCIRLHTTANADVTTPNIVGATAILVVVWSPMQTDGTLLTNNSQHWWMLHVASVNTPCCMLLRVVGSCCAKFETGQTKLRANGRNISQHCWINNLGSCCVRFHVA